MKKTFLKTIFRMFKSNFARFIAITFIIILGVAVNSGLGGVSPNLQNSLNSYFSEHNVSDLIVKSKNIYGFTEQEIEKMQNFDFVKNATGISTFDIQKDELVIRAYYLPFKNLDINKVDLLSGRLPLNINEIVIEQESQEMDKYKINDEIKINYQNVTVVGVVASPLIISKEAEPSNFENENLNLIVYFDTEFNDLGIITDIYLKFNNPDKHNIFSDKYKDIVSTSKTEIIEEFGETNFVYLTLDENFGYCFARDIMEKINIISAIIPVFFVIVVALVVFTTMKRLIESERANIAIYKTLGFSNSKILFKYIIFALICCLIGGTIGIFAGTYTIMPVVYNGLSTQLFIPEVTGKLFLDLGLIVASTITIFVLLVTILVVGKLLKEKPANLLRPKSPKIGKKIFLERISFFWKRLSFKYKSTLRNIFRYVGNFIMTVLSVAGSTAIVFMGLGLLNAANAKMDAGGVVGSSAGSINLIAIIIIIFAMLLSVSVIFNLTNINIEERKRELATLKVLGYNNSEVCGYIFREISIMAIIGIIIGLPFGYLFIGLVFDFVGFGSVSDIQIYSWFLTIAISISFMLIVFLLLFNKIIKTDMNASLKTVD
ncbi:MAG: FtsX-like permease family protein [Clostridia bacterium]|nr:FtsX-like permease family protein [Clostridia bacterium]